MPKPWPPTLGSLAGLAPLLLLPLLAAGCVGPSGLGTVVVELSDHREAIGDFTRFLIEIDRVELHPAQFPPQGGWIDLTPTLARADLTQLVSGAAVPIARGTVAAGPYDAVQLVLSGATGELLLGGVVELEGFSGAGRVEFELPAGETVTIRIDLIVQSQEDHPGGGYVLALGSVQQIGGD